MNALERLSQFVYPPAQGDETAEKRLNRAILMVMAMATSIGGIVWGTIYVLLGVPEVSIWPYGYVVLSAFNLAFYLRTRRYEVLQVGQLLLILLVPVFLQWHLGGFTASGAVMFWSLLSPIVALVVSDEPAEARYWLYGFIGLLLISGFIEASLVPFDKDMPDFGRNLFYVINVFAPGGTTYFIVYYFMGENRRASARMQEQQSRMEEQQMEMEITNEALQDLTLGLEEKVRTSTQELRDALGNLSAIINSLSDGLIVTDLDGRITNHNPTSVMMLGLDDNTLEGQFASEAFDIQLASIISDARRSRESDDIFAIEVPLTAGRIGNAVSTPILLEPQEFDMFDHRTGNTEATIIGTVTLIRDITREKEVDRMKTDFISTVSHELRTPLTSVLGFARIIQKRFGDVLIPQLEGIEDKKVKRATKQVINNVDIIVSEGERLTHLINDVLDIAKMEAGKVEWRIEETSIQEVVERAVNATTGLFVEDSPVDFRSEIDADLPTVNADFERMVQVVVNLISNASKFTEEGSVTCRVKQATDNIIVSVIDTGIGIPQENLNSIFERFTQVGNTMTDKPQGTGLGLPICKQIVEYHGGRIWAESIVGAGTTISFTVPRHGIIPATESHQKVLDDLMKQLQKQVGTVSDDVVSASQKRILIVDDETNIRQLLRQVLENSDYAVDEARDGVEAIKRVKQQRPDLIILDIMMPNVNGFDVATILKSDPETMTIPIIILSIVEDKERGMRIGVERYLHKPINSEALLTEVANVLEERTEPRTVLVMDENASILRTISDVLAAKGYHVVEATNNDELKSKAIDNRPDMIVLTDVTQEQQDLVQTLRFEKGLENVYIVQYK